ncbi:MAG TPA: M3 family metallopeptidase [Fontimonas sp.]
MTPSPLQFEYPPFDLIRDEHFKPAFEAGMREQLAEIDAIASNPQPASFDNTVVAMERSGALLGRVSAVFYNLASSNTNPQIQAIQAEMAPKLAAHNDAILLNPALFARVETLYDGRAGLQLDPESLRLLELLRRDFVRAGAELSAEKQTQLRSINAELSALTTRFQQNLLKDTNDSAVVIDSAAELDGLAADAIAAAAEAAKARGLEGKWLLGLQLPTAQPALSTLTNRAVRERVFKASIMRGNNGNEADNKATLLRIVALRATRAGLLGYADHASYVLEESTALTKQAVNAMLARLTPAAVANVRREAADLQQLIDAQKAGFKLAPWDWAFYAEQLRKQRYAFDDNQLRPYLEMERVLRDGVFYMAEQLYGLTFTERKDLPVYHPDVRVFEVKDADGSVLGLFLADYFARPSKRGGAWMNSFVQQSGLLGTHAVLVNNLNVAKPPAGEPVLLTFDEANTMFHEFGHALHGLFSNVKYPYFSGTAVPRDFVEYPSQVHEMWVTDPTVLKHYARHYQTGEPMPQALVDKVLAAQRFNQGFTTTEYLGATLLDQAWHQLAPGTVVEDALRFEDQALQNAGVKLDSVLPRYRSTYFSHVFAGGYSAGYYAYIWSEVLDADSVEWFKQSGGLKRENGEHFRKTLLSRGNSIEPMAQFRTFRGRDPQIEPLLQRRGLTQEGKK